MAEVGQAWVTVVPSAKGFGKTLDKQVSGDVDSSGKSVGKKFGAAVKVGALAVAGAGVAAFKFLGGAMDEAREAQKVGAQTNAVIKATGGAAGVTAKHVGDLAGALSRKAGIDDEVIQSGQNMLLTFKNVRNEAGKGNKIFDEASKTLIDMSVAMGTEPKQAAIQLGKALNDPIKGITALSRVGVTFTQHQKDVIAKLVATGKTAQAQKIILKELNSEFGGSAKAQATWADKLEVAWGNFKETVGTALLPVVDKISKWLTTKAIPALSKFVTEMQDGTGKGGEFVQKLKDIYNFGKGVVDFFNGLPSPVKKFLGVMVVTTALTSRFGGLLGSFGSKVSSFAASMGTAEGRLAKVKTAAFGLGQVLRTAGLSVGLMAVADSGNRASKSMGALEGAAGGALGGAALGSFILPGVGTAIGAAVGGLAGAVWGLVKASKKGGDAGKQMARDWVGLKATLNQTTGAITAQTKAFVYNEMRTNGVIKTMRELGFTDKQAVDAATQHGAARRKVTAAINSNIAATTKEISTLQREQKSSRYQIDVQYRKSVDAKLDEAKARLKNLRAAQNEMGAVGRAAKATQKNTQVTRTYSKAIKTLPPKVQTEIKEKGLAPTRKGIIDLTRKYDLARKDVKTLIKENGGTPTKKMVQSIIDKAKELDRQHPNVKVSASTAQANAQMSSFFRSWDGRVVHLRGEVAHGTAARAKGGPVTARTPYIVGEVGPELFIPKNSGRIIPNDRLRSADTPPLRGAGGGDTFNIYESVSPRATAREVSRRQRMAGAV